jgi:glycosyltransferase involved in cell wall biosynthesis
MAGRDIYVFLGRIHEKKGCRELAEAWAEACKSAPFREHSVLVFCGPLDGLESFPDEVRALDAQLGNVRFAGPQYGPDKDRSIQHATFFCLPSKSEGLPVTILDAWATGVPTIMTPECNLDIGFDRGAALRTGFAASEVIATLQEAAALTAEQRAAMQANARALVAEHYAPESVAAGLLAMYRAALAGKPASAATVS